MIAKRFKAKIAFTGKKKNKHKSYEAPFNIVKSYFFSPLLLLKLKFDNEIRRGGGGGGKETVETGVGGETWGERVNSASQLILTKHLISNGQCRHQNL